LPSPDRNAALQGTTPAAGKPEEFKTLIAIEIQLLPTLPVS
jgi:hypothetical protein